MLLAATNVNFSEHNLLYTLILRFRVPTQRDKYISLLHLHISIYAGVQHNNKGIISSEFNFQSILQLLMKPD